MKTLVKASLLLAAMIACAVRTPAQDSKDEKAAVVRQLVDGQNYVFVAQSAIPLRGQLRQLTGAMYDLTVTKTSVKAYLPYFGEAYIAPMDPSQGGIKFSTDSFSYKMTVRKKGGWDVSIKPGGAGDVQELNLTISTDGYASLQIIPANRQAISYNGYVDAIKISRQ